MNFYDAFMQLKHLVFIHISCDSLASSYSNLDVTSLDFNQDTIEYKYIFLT
jgi:hypothetical protein